MRSINWPTIAPFLCVITTRIDELLKGQEVYDQEERIAVYQELQDYL